MKRNFLLLIFSAVLILLSACCNIDYTGTSAEPLDSDARIELYYSLKQIPKVKYEELGNAEVSGGTLWSVQDLKAKLIDFARKNGSNAILIESIDRIPAGAARADQINNQQSAGWLLKSEPRDSANKMVNNIQEIKPGEEARPEQDIYKYHIKAKLLRMPRK